MTPAARRAPATIALVDPFLPALPARAEPAHRAIGATAASLRATHGLGLRLPDALVVATAIILAADRIITTDTRWPALGIQVDVLVPVDAGEARATGTVESA